MKEIQKMEAGKYYMIESTASANSVYFEDDALAKLFFCYCDYYLKDYLKVEEYVLNKDGWAMLIKVRSAQTIRKYYQAVETSRKTKDKDEVQTESKAIWKILSERIRLFISTYVRVSNKILKREGSLVRRKYGRYSFNNLKAAQDYIAKIRNDRHEMQQSKEKYRGIQEHFQLAGTILTNPMRSSIWLSQCEEKDGKQEQLEEIFGFKLPILQGLGNLVALNLNLNKMKAKSPLTKPTKP